MAALMDGSLADGEHEFMSTLLERFSYAPLRALLKSLEFETQVGFSNIKDTIPYQFAETSRSRSYTSFKNSHYEHVLFGNKKTTFFNFEDSDLIEKVRERLFTLNLINPSSDIFTTRILAKSELSARRLHYPELVHVLDQGTQLHLIYSSVHSYSYRKDLPASNQYEDFDEIVGIKNIYNQCFDVITVRDDGFIDVKIDYIKDTEKGRFLANSFFSNSLNYLKTHFQQSMNSASEVPFSWPQPVNLKSVLAPLSEDATLKVINLAQMDNDGHISEFSTAQADVRSNVVRQTGNQVLKDNGDEPKNFAFAGSINRELSNLSYQPQLIIKAQPKVLQSEAGRIDHAIIKDNLGREEYDIFRSKLVSD